MLGVLPFCKTGAGRFNCQGVPTSAVQVNSSLRNYTIRASAYALAVFTSVEYPIHNTIACVPGSDFQVTGPPPGLPRVFVTLYVS